MKFHIGERVQCNWLDKEIFTGIIIDIDEDIYCVLEEENSKEYNLDRDWYHESQLKKLDNNQ